jgi:hypothetical protein
MNVPFIGSILISARGRLTGLGLLLLRLART